MDQLNELLERAVNEPIDAGTVSEILGRAPFVQIDGLINPRDLTDESLATLKKACAYRSGSLESLTSKGREQLKALGVKKTIGLRSADEVAAFPDLEIEGIAALATNTTCEWNKNEGELGPADSVTPRSVPIDLANLYLKIDRNERGNLSGLAAPHARQCATMPTRLFSSIAQITASDTMLVYSRRLTTSIAIAGKDRAGVAAGLLLALAGVPEEYICRGFALTRIAFEPARGLSTMKLTGDKPVDVNDETVKWKMETFGSSEAEVMAAFLENIDEKYGGVESCVKSLFDFDDNDIEKIKRSLAGW